MAFLVFTARYREHQQRVALAEAERAKLLAKNPQRTRGLPTPKDFVTTSEQVAFNNRQAAEDYAALTRERAERHGVHVAITITEKRPKPRRKHERLFVHLPAQLRPPR